MEGTDLILLTVKHHTCKLDVIYWKLQYALLNKNIITHVLVVCIGGNFFTQ